MGGDGMSRGKTKLTWEAVQEIRRLAADGQNRAEIAAAYGISRTTVTRVSTGQSWRSPTPDAKKLTRDLAREIRALYAMGFTQPEIAAEYGVSQPVIGRIVRGVSWREVAA